MKAPAKLVCLEGYWNEKIFLDFSGEGPLYMDHVLQAEHGCDFDFLRKT